jgi:hypothetical protein
MQMHNVVHIPDHLEDRWAELVGQARADVGTLVEQFAERVGQMEVYRAGVVSMEQVKVDAFGAFGYLLGQIRGNGDFKAEVIWTARRFGRARARIGIPLNDLLTAVRLDFQVLWAAFRFYAGPEDRELLVAGVEKIWAAVERYSTEVQSGYLEEASRMADKRHSERARLMTAILNSEVPDTEELHNLGRALGVDVESYFVVVATRVQHDNELNKVAGHLRASSHTVHIHSTGDHSLLISNWKGEDLQPLRRLLSASICGVAPVIQGLSGLARACRLAVEIVELNVSEVRGPTELKDLWLPFLAARLRDAAPELVASVLAGFKGTSEAEQQRLTEVALAFAHSGSMTKAGLQMYCHRNTVLNRLRKLEEITGYDMAVPADAALLLLAITAAQAETAS